MPDDPSSHRQQPRHQQRGVQLRRHGGPGQALPGEVRGEAAEIVAEARQEAEAIKSGRRAKGRKAGKRPCTAVEENLSASNWPRCCRPGAGGRRHPAGQAGLAGRIGRRSAVHVAAAIAQRRDPPRADPAAGDRRGPWSARPWSWPPAARTSASTSTRPTTRPWAAEVQTLVRSWRPGALPKSWPMPAITPGGCRVETRFGTIDQQFETQLARIEEELTVKPIAEQLEAIMPTALARQRGADGRHDRLRGRLSRAGRRAWPKSSAQAGPPLLAEVIGFRDELTLLYPLGDLAGVRHGNRVRLVRTTRWLRVGDGAVGPGDRRRRARPSTASRSRRWPTARRFHRAPPHPCTRPRIDDAAGHRHPRHRRLLTCGKGQRMGIFAGSGVGKSVLLGMMARYTAADVIVIALIGERGREVNEFIERDLGPEGLAKSVVVVATSDEPALVRVQAASTATAIAEYFRDQGKDVLLLMDSLTRFALAQREIGLAAGEPPATRGYPPSVFALLPKLVERAGRSPQGSITAFYTVLVEADDPNEPISDAVRGLLDGHTWLSRKLAARGTLSGHRRAGKPQPADARRHQRRSTARRPYAVRELLAAYRDHEDLISIGAYRRGSNPTVDVAIEMQDEIQRFPPPAGRTSGPPWTTPGKRWPGFASRRHRRRGGNKWRNSTFDWRRC